MIAGLSKQSITSAAAPTFSLATIGAVYSDGVSLIFDGAGAASEKHYKCNTSVSFSAGDRVKICKISGTYIVEYVVGEPGGTR